MLNNGSEISLTTISGLGNSGIGGSYIDNFSDYLQDFEFSGALTSMPGFLSNLGFTCTRNSLKHVLQDGALVQLANNQFGTSYDPVTGLYGYLPEPAATNLLLNSGLVGGGANPTGMSRPVAGGTSTPVPSSIATFSTAYYKEVSNNRDFFVATHSVTAGVTYAWSVYVESISHGLTAGQILNKSNSDLTGTVTFPICEANPLGGSSGIVNAGRLVCTYTNPATTSTEFRFGIGVVSNVSGSCTLSMPQAEVGTYHSTFILTPTGATATRAADVLTCPLANIAGFNSAAYTMLVDARTDMSDALLRYSLAISDTTANNYAAITRTAAGLIGTDVTSGGSPQVAIAETSPGTARAKSAFSCQANNFLRAVNGTAGTSDAGGSMPVSPTTLYIGCLNGASQRNSYIYSCALITRALTQTQLNALTS